MPRKSGNIDCDISCQTLFYSGFPDQSVLTLQTKRSFLEATVKFPSEEVAQKMCIHFCLAFSPSSGFLPVSTQMPFLIQSQWLRVFIFRVFAYHFLETT